MKKYQKLVVAGAVFVLLAGCAENPASSIVKEKNLDKMLEQAVKEDAASYSDVAKEVADNYALYQTQIKNESLNVTVNVDAKVDIPDVEQLSVYRVSQKKIEQDFLDKVRETVSSGTTWYDGYATQIETKAQLAQKMQEEKEWMQEVEREDPSDIQVYREEYQREMEEYEQLYENAPDHINITDYPSDNQLHNVQQLYDSHQGVDYFEWLYSLNNSGDIYYGVNDGENDYQTLYAQNDENYGNGLKYAKSREDYPFLSTVLPEAELNGVFYKAGEEPDLSQYGYGSYEEGLQKIDGEITDLSEEDARQQADGFLARLGLTDYQCNGSGFFAQTMRFASVDGYLYRDVYHFLYLRAIDGVFVDNTADAKLTDGWQGDTYVKKLWGGEIVIVSVNQDGIVGFRYSTPLSVDETVVEKTSIKPFSEIKDIFEKMVVIENAREDETVSIEVTDVKLVYARISEKDSFDTGLLVPIWDFHGNITSDGFGEVTDTSILAINAIDGSVINWELGY